MSKISYPETDHEKARLYLHCMHEVWLRARVVEEIIESQMIALFKREACYLHFRHMAELLAIACLAAQGDYQSHRDFTQSYSPPKIFDAMRIFFDDFFPRPAKIHSSPGHHHMAMDPVDGAYGESEVVSLWQRAGDHLHRASVKKYLRTTFGSPPANSDLSAHLQGIMLLVKSHVVPIRTLDPTSLKLWMYVEFLDGSPSISASFLRADQVRSTMTIEHFMLSALEPES